MVRVLITSAGGINGVNVIKALRSDRLMRFFIVTTDAETMNPARHMSEKFYLTPKASDPKFIPVLKKICLKEKIQVLLPMYSAEIAELVNHQAEFALVGTKMALPSPAVFDLTWNKEKTHTFFAAHHIPFPPTYKKAELSSAKLDFPLFIKTTSGSGSKDAMTLIAKKDLAYHTNRLKNFIVQAHIGGEEYTIDALGDLKGKMIAASPRLRLEVKGGLATKSVTVYKPELVRYVKKIIETLKIAGPVNIQCKVWKNKPYFIEINTRFPSGGLPLTVRAGFNMPLLTVKMLLGKPLGKIKIKHGLAMLRYWDALFTDKHGKKFHGFNQQFV
ncbi:MAG: ATP-grasp domain-containing protein [bacterium]|nr:ATP-grasp domain-containing protein [bacterium]